ncbi:carbohydrate esterase family 4 protein [Crepidotus variabilis]|uniref:Carbohydrate esterase family 4 protein n=1 Tax=Crepidotus variabilis TaxID=179855 RepID=A0A9P6ERX4_9AGAR|nr:carbohydrate esterase family 4 protein [Crepidotus variabilis]
MIASSAVVLALALSVSAGVTQRKRGGGQLVTSCTVPNTAALTFDDGPYMYMTEIVDMLKANDAKGTFFVNGHNWGCIWEETNMQNIRYARDNGMQIASHTWHHKDLNTLTLDQLRSEMSSTNDAICKILGTKPAFMRPPFGNYNDDVLSVVGEMHQTAVTWNLDSGDSMGAEVSAQNQACDDVIAQHPQGIISLQHEVYEPSVHQVLPSYISKMKEAGYKLVTVAECLGMEPYFDGECPVSKRGDDSYAC